MSSRVRPIGFFILAAVVLIVYHPALGIGFVGDDWTFVGRAASLAPLEYLIGYFNPLAQGQWYRPVQGLQYFVEYFLFRGNATGYHLVHILFHLTICVLLFDLTRRISGNARIGFLAALIFATLSAFDWSVMWPADAAPLETMFYLGALWLWWRFLQNGRAIFFGLTFLAFLAALFSREPSVTLPLTLFLMERLLTTSRRNWRETFWRYLPFGAVWVIFLFLQLNIRSQSASFAIYRGYTLGTHTLNNLWWFLTRLTFPWGLAEPWAALWLVIAAALFFSVVFF